MKGWEKALIVLAVVVAILIMIVYMFTYALNTILPNWLFTPRPPGKGQFAPGGALYDHPTGRKAPMGRRR